MSKTCVLLYLGIALMSGCSPSLCTSCQSAGVLLHPALDQLDFDNAFSVTTQYDKSRNNLTVRLQLQPGYHAYAVGELVGRPLDVVVLPQGGWAARGPVHMRPGNAKQFAGETSLVLEDEVVISVTLQPGQGPLHAILKLHMCADGACDRPRDYPFVVEVP